MFTHRYIIIINSENNVADAFTCSLSKQREKLHVKAARTEWTPASSQRREQLKDANYGTDVGKFSLK